MAQDAAPAITLALPADRAVRLIALARLADASDAALQLGSGSAPDAGTLHDFRVAVRRLRSWLRSWRPVLHNSMRRKDERRIRRIARAAGPARDVDVQLEWLAAAEGSGRGANGPVLAAIGARLEGRREPARTAATEAAEEFLAHHDRLQRRLAVYTVDLRNPKEVQPFGHELARTTREAAEALRLGLSMVRSAEDRVAIHDVRIAAKRLRYLLEPAGTLTRQADALIDALRSLQDTAGAFRDAGMLKATLADMPDQVPLGQNLARRLDAKAGRAYSALEKTWLGRSATRFFARIEKLATSLEGT